MPNWLCCRHLSGFEWAVHSHGRLRWAPCIHPGGRTRQTDLQQHVTRQQCLKLGSRHGMPGSCPACTRDGDWRLVRNGSLLAFSADVRAARPENIQGPWRSSPHLRCSLDHCSALCCICGSWPRQCKGVANGSLVNFAQAALSITVTLQESVRGRAKLRARVGHLCRWYERVAEATSTRQSSWMPPLFLFLMFCRVVCV